MFLKLTYLLGKIYNKIKTHIMAQKTEPTQVEIYNVGLLGGDEWQIFDVSTSKPISKKYDKLKDAKSDAEKWGYDVLKVHESASSGGEIVAIKKFAEDNGIEISVKGNDIFVKGYDNFKKLSEYARSENLVSLDFIQESLSDDQFAEKVIKNWSKYDSPEEAFNDFVLGIHGDPRGSMAGEKDLDKVLKFAKDSLSKFANDKQKKEIESIEKYQVFAESANESISVGDSVSWDWEYLGTPVTLSGKVKKINGRNAEVEYVAFGDEKGRLVTTTKSLDQLTVNEAGIRTEVTDPVEKAIMYMGGFDRIEDLRYSVGYEENLANTKNALIAKDKTALRSIWNITPQEVDKFFGKLLKDYRPDLPESEEAEVNEAYKGKALPMFEEFQSNLRKVNEAKQKYDVVLYDKDPKTPSAKEEFKVTVTSSNPDEAILDATFEFEMSAKSDYYDWTQQLNPTAVLKSGGKSWVSYNAADIRPSAFPMNESMEIDDTNESVGKEHKIKFDYKGKTHEFSFKPEESDWWTGFESHGISFDVHYDEDYGDIVVYEVVNGQTKTDKTIYKQKI